MNERQIIERYNNLTAIHRNPNACFVCGAVRKLINALVKGPNPTNIGGPIAGRGHGVCRPCVKGGEATALR